MATEYKLSYTASEIDKKLGKVDSLVASVNGVKPDESGNVNIGADGGGSAIIDVIELPTENINNSAFYRLMIAKWVTGGEEVTNGSVCYCVNNLPESGQVVTDFDMTAFIGYYNIADNEVYGYVDAMLGSGFGVPAGWYTFDALAQVAGVGFNGVETEIDNLPDNGYFGILLKHDFYIYQDGWCQVPFGYEKQPEFDIQWDGVIGDKFALDLTPLGFEGVYFVKVSDDVFTVEQLIGATHTQTSGYEWTLRSTDLDTTTYPGAINADNGIIICYSADDTNSALGLPAGYLTNGVYFAYDTSRTPVNYTSRLVASTKLTKIDEKFLPDMSVDVNSLGLHSVARTGNYNDLYNTPTVYTDVIRYNTTQNLGVSSKARARANIDVYSKSEVDAKIGGGIDLTNYATKDSLTNYATKDSLTNYATKDSLTNYATKEYVDGLISSAIGGSY